MLREHDHDSAAGDEKSDVINIPVESLFDQGAFQEMWPDSLCKNTAFVDQIETRKRLVHALHNVQSRIDHPAIPLENYLSEEKISEEHVADLYEVLADLLLDTPEYGRIVLYLPFEYLFSSGWKPSTERLVAQAERFRNAYMQTWERLLCVHDVRANFVDGDVLETEKRDGDPPRVVKAAHLIPFLVQKGWISVDEVFSMYGASGDDILREGIADTFGVLRNLDLVEEDFANIHGMPKKATAVEEDSKSRVEPRSIEPGRLQQDIEQRLALVHVGQSDSTQKRQLWLAEVQRQRVIEEIGDEVRLSLQHHLLTEVALEQLMLPEAHLPSQLTLIGGVRQAIEHAAMENIHDAELLYSQFHERLYALWERQHPETQPYLQKLFFRLHNLGIVDIETLHSLGLSVPSISGPFMENARRMEAESGDVQRILASMRSNPELMQYVYPLVLMYGSRLKGYGTKDADIDLGVFIKPSTPEGMRATVREMLASIFTSDSHQDPVTEFWLERDKNGLAVHDFDSHDRAFGRSLWPHVLLFAAWKGDIHAMRELHAGLLPTYFRKTCQEMYGHNVRDLYLESLEQDLLQYRLMHKGYHRYYPSYGGLKGHHTDRIDGSSTFWDSGYRAVATKLFVEKVFLPRL